MGYSLSAIRYPLLAFPSLPLRLLDDIALRAQRGELPIRGRQLGKRQY
jgi:hypothetical protein